MVFCYSYFYSYRPFAIHFKISFIHFFLQSAVQSVRICIDGFFFFPFYRCCCWWYWCCCCPMLLPFIGTVGAPIQSFSIVIILHIVWEPYQIPTHLLVTPILCESSIRAQSLIQFSLWIAKVCWKLKRYSAHNDIVVCYILYFYTSI